MSVRLSAGKAGASPAAVELSQHEVIDGRRRPIRVLHAAAARAGPAAERPSDSDRDGDGWLSPQWPETAHPSRPTSPGRQSAARSTCFRAASSARRRFDELREPRRLSPGFPGTIAGPESPPRSSASRESSRSPFHCLAGPWHFWQCSAEHGANVRFKEADLLPPSAGNRLEPLQPRGLTIRKPTSFPSPSPNRFLRQAPRATTESSQFRFGLHRAILEGLHSGPSRRSTLCGVAMA